MALLARQITTGTGMGGCDLGSWQAETGQLLEEHHLVAWSPVARERLTFGVGLQAHLRGLPDTEVCVIHGQHVVDLESFCQQIERVVDGPTLERRVDGPRGVVALLRRRNTLQGRPATKRRYYLWHDAHALLKRDAALFGRLVDAIAGVAAEAEYASEDLLIIHRAVFLGAPALDLYAEDPYGQFRAWSREGASAHGDRPLWDVVSGLARPPVIRYRIDGAAM